MNADNRTICLTIVLRPATEITRKCLESAAPFIDSWVILTCQPPAAHHSPLEGESAPCAGGINNITPPLRGSQRPALVGGQLSKSAKLIAEILGHLPGQTIPHDLTDFATAWRHAFNLAGEMADTVLMLEADERIQCLEPAISLPPGAQIGLMEIRAPRFSLHQPRLLRSDVTVEFLDSASGQAGQILFDDHYICDAAPHVHILPRLRDDGIRLRKIPTLNDDIARLHCRLDSEPAQAATAARFNILLSTARACLQSNKTRKAVQYFQAVAEQVTDGGQADGDMADLYWQSRYFLAVIHISKNRIPPALDLLSACIEQDLKRLEPFMRLAEIFEANNEPERALTLLELAVDVPQPALARYVEPSIYHYSARMMAANLSAGLGRSDVAIGHADKLGQHKNLPKEIEKQRKELLAEQHNIKQTHSITPLPDRAGDRLLRGSRRTAPEGGTQPSERTQPTASPPPPLPDTSPTTASSGADSQILNNITSPPAPRLTIGMATYDDFDGVYFTIMSIILYHRAALPDIELLVIDNNPDSSHGQTVATFCRQIGQIRYLPAAEYKSTAIRDRIFAEARGEFVLCVDCHVFLHNGALSRLLEYCADHPDSVDLLHGPLCYDNFNLDHLSTHMEKRWNGGFFGVWGTNPRVKNGDGEPFEIPLQGMGLFACRRAAWPGFNRKFRGFGGEEGYIHEKIRQQGGKVLCLPFLYWSHRFGRPNGTRYVNSWEDRIRNYLIGWDELGMPVTELLEHFSHHINPQAAAQANAWFIQEKRGPLWAFDTIFWLSDSDDTWQRNLKELASLSIDRITQKIELSDALDTKTDDLVAAQQRILDLSLRQNLDNIVIINGSREFIKNPRKKLLDNQSKLEDKMIDVLATNQFCQNPDPSVTGNPTCLAMDHLLIIRNNAFQAAQAIITAGQPLTLTNLQSHQPNLSIQRL